MKLTYAALREKNEIQRAVRQFNIASAHQLTDIYQHLNQIGLSQELLNFIVPVYESPSLFQPELLDPVSTIELFSYLKRANGWYRQIKFPEIETAIFEFLENYPKDHLLYGTLKEHFSEFRLHLAQRLNCPANESMDELSGHETEKECLVEHERNDEDLSAIMTLLMQIRVPVKWILGYRVLISRLQVLKEYLTAHRLIESYIFFGRIGASEEVSSLMDIQTDRQFGNLEIA
jgi:hypothetical protein